MLEKPENKIEQSNDVSSFATGWVDPGLKGLTVTGMAKQIGRAEQTENKVFVTDHINQVNQPIDTLSYADLASRSSISSDAVMLKQCEIATRELAKKAENLRAVALYGALVTAAGCVVSTWAAPISMLSNYQTTIAVLGSVTSLVAGIASNVLFRQSVRTATAAEALRERIFSDKQA